MLATNEQITRAVEDVAIMPKWKKNIVKQNYRMRKLWLFQVGE